MYEQPLVIARGDLLSAALAKEPELSPSLNAARTPAGAHCAETVC